MGKGYKVKIIVAQSGNRVIGKDGDLPWRLPEDMKRFSSLTSGHFVLMGRKTYYSLPTKFRPLPNRENIVLTRSADIPEVITTDSIDSAVREFKNQRLDNQDLWIIGGGEIYKECLAIADELHVTQVDAHIEGDTFFPEIQKDEFELISEEKPSVQMTPEFSFLIYRRKL